MFFSIAQSTSVSVVYFCRALSFLLVLRDRLTVGSRRTKLVLMFKARVLARSTLITCFRSVHEARELMTFKKNERDATHVWVRDQGQSPFTSPSPPCPLTFSLRTCFFNLFTSPSRVTALSPSPPFAPC